jgi:hypothetical protein
MRKSVDVPYRCRGRAATLPQSAAQIVKHIVNTIETKVDYDFNHGNAA